MTDDLVTRIRIVFEDTPEILSTLDVETYSGAEAHTHLLGMWNTMKDAADRIERLEKALRYIAEIKGEIAEEPPEEIGEETHKMWISLILCAVSAEAALEKKDE